MWQEGTGNCDLKSYCRVEGGIGTDARLRLLWMRVARILDFGILNIQQFLVIT